MDTETLTKLLNDMEKRKDDYYGLMLTLQGMVRDYYRLTADIENPSQELKALWSETFDLLKGLQKRE